MNLSDRGRPVPLAGKIAIGVALLIFVVVQGRILLGAHGILSRYTFLQGFTVFGTLMMADPLTTAGLVDIDAMELVFIVILLNGLPRGPAYPFLCVLFIATLLTYPGLAGFGFLLLYWRRFGQFRP